MDILAVHKFRHLVAGRDSCARETSVRKLGSRMRRAPCASPRCRSQLREGPPPAGKTSISRKKLRVRVDARVSERPSYNCNMCAPNKAEASTTTTENKFNSVFGTSLWKTPTLSLVVLVIRLPIAYYITVPCLYRLVSILDNQ